MQKLIKKFPDNQYKYAWILMIEFYVQKSSDNTR